jgi:hypothetical protein
VPTVLRKHGYRFFFYSGDRYEPPHVHVEKDRMMAKFWLRPVRLASSGGFRRTEIKKVHRVVDENVNLFVEAWNEFFGD